MFMDSTQTKLTLTSGGSAYTFATYNVNSAFDVTPALLNTSMPGYNEWSGIYNKYAVLYTKITTTFSLYNTVDPVYVGIFIRPIFQEGGLNSWTGWRNLLGNPLPHKEIMTSSGDANKGRVTLSVGVPIWKLWGNKIEYYGSGAFSAVINSNPSVLQQGFVYMLSNDGQSMNAECAVKTTVTMYVKFYNKRTLFV